jgi:hypothetical protein
MQQLFPKVTNIAINAKGGALTVIRATIMASRVEVMEDPAYNAGAPQGLAGYYCVPDATVAADANVTYSPAGAQVWLGQTAGQRGRAYQPIAFGSQRTDGWKSDIPAVQGTPLLALTTNSANAGGVLLVEWP